MTRLLTEDEIEDILDFIKPKKSIPIETALSIVEITKQKFRKDLIKQKIYPEIIPELKKILEKNYIESLIHPGESVGIIAAQSIGERQTQNSISYDEEIIIKNHNTMQKLKIGEFIDNYIKNFGSFKLDGDSEIQECENVQIMTISEDEKIQWQNISEVSRHPPKGNLVKVTTESGRTVISTLSHSHLKKDKRKVIPVLGSDLRLRDRIPVIKNTPKPECTNSFINVQKYIDCDNIRIGPKEYDSDGSTPISSPSNKNNEYIHYKNERLPKNIEIDKYLIWFIALFLANGELCYRQIHLYCYDRYDTEFYEYLEKFCIKYDLEFDVKQNGNYFFQNFKNDKTTIYSIRSKILSKFIQNICKIDIDEFDGKVPEFIYGLDNDLIIKFLKTYFSEGGFNKTEKDINKDICFLLTYFGIYSRIKNSKIYIQKKYINKFKCIFDISININNLEEDFQTLDDKELIDETIKLNSNFKKKYNKKIKINNDLELDDFMSHCLNYENLFMDDIELEYHSQVFNSDVVWEKITKLELIFEKDYDFQYVYDFSVKGNETFALFSGIVVHNTLNTFHKAKRLAKLYQKYS